MTHRILIVDDDLHIREVIRVALKKAGMTVFEARDGKEALTRFAADRPDLIVLDIGMPEFDGLEVCRQIRKSSDVPILFLSARDDEIDRILGPGDRRRRLCDQAVQPARTGRAGQRHPAPHDLARRRTPRAPWPRCRKAGSRRSRTAHRRVRRHAASPDRHRVRHPQGIPGAAGAVFSREQIMSAAYQLNIQVSDRTIDSHIRNIRAKLSAVNCDNVIETVHGVGFKLGRCEPQA